MPMNLRPLLSRLEIPAARLPSDRWRPTRFTSFGTFSCPVDLGGSRVHLPLTNKFNLRAIFRDRETIPELIIEQRNHKKLRPLNAQDGIAALDDRYQDVRSCDRRIEKWAFCSPLWADFQNFIFKMFKNRKKLFGAHRDVSTIWE